MNIQVLKRYPTDRPMIVRYWQPWREVETLRHQIDQVFNELQRSAGQPSALTPAIELKDNGDAFTLRVQLPGVDTKDLDIQVTKEAVAITGEYRHEHQPDEQSYVRSEFRYGKFRRVVSLPAAVENNQVQADYKDGVLSLTLPKVTEARNPVVKVDLTKTEPTADAS